MAAQIFVSCGQATDRERAIAAALRRVLEEDGFSVYVAIEAQSVEDVNSGIIRQLERSDYYVFIDFRREALGNNCFRGSVFTHQELAIAHRSGFEHTLFFQETGVELQGLLRYMGANPTQFGPDADLADLVRRTVRGRRWTPAYSRHLIATRLRGSEQIIRTPQITGRFFFVDVENRRPDVAAYDTIARLEFIRAAGGERQPSPNRSPLKVTGQRGFSQIIWPQSHGALDVLAVGVEAPHGLYLHTSLDLPDIEPFLIARGGYELDYAVLARDFPVLRFAISVVLTGDLSTTQIALIDSNR